ncbi:hypothetical protein SUGI_0876870 [Cryptomeria japonica]|nr:hypothetical protein SUGI_0876870 [Cryptomeria japonica]
MLSLCGARDRVEVIDWFILAMVCSCGARDRVEVVDCFILAMVCSCGAPVGVAAYVSAVGPLSGPLCRLVDRPLAGECPLVQSCGELFVWGRLSISA